MLVFSDALVVTVVSILGPRLAGEPRRETRIRGGVVKSRLRASLSELSRLSAGETGLWRVRRAWRSATLRGCAPWLAPQTPALKSADLADFADSADAHWRGNCLAIFRDR